MAALAEFVLSHFDQKELLEEARFHLDKALTRSSADLCDKQQEAERWLSWAKAHRQLKIVSCAVPGGIIPDDVRVTLHDIKVFTKYGPDDDIYDNNKDIRDKVARGNCFMEIEGGNEAGTTVLVYALKKFTGGLGDDDDRDKGDDFTWKKYFTRPLEDAAQVVATRKANGEAAHFSVRKIGGKFVLCGGSKNVHLLFRTREDIEKYTDSRFRVATEVSSAIYDALDALDECTHRMLLDFMVQTELTAIFEILNPKHQHVEDLSHLPTSELKFICWTSSELESCDDQKICNMPPHIGIEIAKSLGLTSVSYDILPATAVDARMMQIRHGYNYEGEVLYFLDGNSNVIGLLKKKTIWYIICRAIREKCRYAAHSWEKSPDNFSLNLMQKKIEKRIEEIQQWLSLDDATTEAWQDLGVSFLYWVIHSLEQRDITTNDVADLFPVVWKRFLQSTGKSDLTGETGK